MTTKKTPARNAASALVALALGAALSGAACGGHAENGGAGPGSIGGTGHAGFGPSAAGGSGSGGEASGGYGGLGSGGGSQAGSSLGGAPAAGAPAGEAPEGGSGGVAGDVTIDVRGVLTVTYTPASTNTVVTVTPDPSCAVFGEDIERAGAFCVNLTLGGDIIGSAQLCFAKPSDLKEVFSCQLAAHECLSPDTVHYSGSVRYCCAEALLNASGCVPTTNLTGSVAYATGVDSDKDYLANLEDNCPLVQNAIQDDEDNDDIGDSCDNCPTVANQDQADSNHNGIGDACESGGGGGAGVSGRGGMHGASGGGAGVSGMSGGGSGGSGA